LRGRRAAAPLSFCFRGRHYDSKTPLLALRRIKLGVLAWTSSPHPTTSAGLRHRQASRVSDEWITAVGGAKPRSGERNPRDAAYWTTEPRSGGRNNAGDAWNMFMAWQNATDCERNAHQSIHGNVPATATRFQILFPARPWVSLAPAALRSTHGCGPTAASAAGLSVSKVGLHVKDEHPAECWNCQSLALRNPSASPGDY